MLQTERMNIPMPVAVIDVGPLTAEVGGTAANPDIEACSCHFGKFFCFSFQMNIDKIL